MKPTCQRVREIFNYDPSTGVLTWKTKTCFKVVVGRVAGSINSDGYVAVGVDGKTYYAHQIIWLWMTGEWVPLVDHKNTITGDNRWDNLRAASKSENALNARKRTKNASGYKGVSWHTAGGKWQSHCGPQYLGLFSSKEEAHAAYIAAAGEFARAS